MTANPYPFPSFGSSISDTGIGGLGNSTLSGRLAPYPSSANNYQKKYKSRYFTKKKKRCVCENFKEWDQCIGWYSSVWIINWKYYIIKTSQIKIFNLSWLRFFYFVWHTIICLNLDYNYIGIAHVLWNRLYTHMLPISSNTVYIWNI